MDSFFARMSDEGREDLRKVSERVSRLKSKLKTLSTKED